MKKIIKKLSAYALLILAGLSFSAAADAANFDCSITAMRGNKWICTQETGLCMFKFTGSQLDKKLKRKNIDGDADVAVVVEKWTDKMLIIREDRIRIDNLFIEQYFYRIELDTGKFLVANDYMTNSGRYLSKDDLAAMDKKHFGYNRPSFFSEPGRCKMKIMP